MNLKMRALLVRLTKRQSVRGSDYHSIPMNKQAAIAAVIALTSILGACEAPQPVDLILMMPACTTRIGRFIAFNARH